MEIADQKEQTEAGLMKMKILITEGKNPRGIPASVFIVSRIHCTVALLPYIVSYPSHARMTLRSF